jgi:hypothetical protein
MNTQELIKKLEAGEVVDQSALIKALEASQKASNSDRVAKYGKNHECKTYLTPATLHKDLAKQLQAQGYKSQKDFSYHMAETFEALFASLDNVASLDPAHIVQALEQFEGVDSVD